MIKVSKFLAEQNWSGWNNLSLEQKRNLCGKLNWATTELISGNVVRQFPRCRHPDCEKCKQYDKYRRNKKGNFILSGSWDKIKYEIFSNDPRNDNTIWRQIKRKNALYLRVAAPSGAYIYTNIQIYKQQKEAEMAGFRKNIMYAVHNGLFITGTLKPQKTKVLYSEYKIESIGIDFNIIKELAAQLPDKDREVLLAEKLKQLGYDVTLLPRVRR